MSGVRCQPGPSARIWPCQSKEILLSSEREISQIHRANLDCGSGSLTCACRWFNREFPSQANFYKGRFKRGFCNSHWIFPTPDTLYETSLKANRRTAEYRILNVEGWNRFAQSFYKIDRSAKKAHGRQNTFLRHSTFIIRYSIFAFSKFLFRFDRPLVCRRLG